MQHVCVCVCVCVCVHTYWSASAELSQLWAPPVAGRVQAEARPEHPVLSFTHSGLIHPGLTHPAHLPLSSSSPSSYHSSPGHQVGAAQTPALNAPRARGGGRGSRVRGPGSRPVLPADPHAAEETAWNTQTSFSTGNHGASLWGCTPDLICSPASSVWRGSLGGVPDRRTPGDRGRAGVEEGREQPGWAVTGAQPGGAHGHGSSASPTLFPGKSLFLQRLPVRGPHLTVD